MRFGTSAQAMRRFVCFLAINKFLNNSEVTQSFLSQSWLIERPRTQSLSLNFLHWSMPRKIFLSLELSLGI